MNTLKQLLARVLLGTLFLGMFPTELSAAVPVGKKISSVVSSSKTAATHPTIFSPTARDFSPSKITKVNNAVGASQIDSARLRRLAAAKAVASSVLETFLAFSGGEKYALGPAKNNQVLTFIDGKIVWRDVDALHSAAGGSPDVVHEPGRGRMPSSDSGGDSRHMGGTPVQTATTTTTSDGISLATADSRYVNVSGDTMDGALSITSNGLGLIISGTASGNALHAEHLLTVSGSSIFDGSARFNSSVTLNNVTYTFPASDGAGSGKVLKTNAAGQLSWADDNAVGTGLSQASGDSRYVNVSGDTMTGALTINLSSGFIGLKVLNTASGNILHAEKDLTSSGTLTVSSTARFKSNLNTVGTISGAALQIMAGSTNYILGSLGIGTTNPKAKLDVTGTISGTTLTISRNGSFSGSLIVQNNIVARSTISGSTINGFNLGSCNGSSQKLLYNNSTQKFECGSDLNSGGTGTFGTGNVITIGDSRYVNTSGDAMTGALTINLSSGYLGLKVLQTASGNILHAEKSLTSSGTLTVSGITRLKSNLNVVGTISGAALQIMAGSTNYILGSLGIGTTNPKAKLDVLGTISGSTLVISRNGSFSGSLVVQNNITARGTISGSTINGFNLGSCNGSSQKLLYNNSTQKFECGSDLNSGGTGTFGTGNVITVGDGRYVNTSGDTMTGALTINLSSGFIGLKIIQTASGNILHAEKNLTSSGGLVFEGAASGSSLYIATSLQGAGLTNCTGSNKLLWDSATGRFSCGIDQTSGSGLDQNSGDARYVNVSGDTMTGALTINLSSGFIGLKVLQTASGNILHAEKDLTSSGTLTVSGIARFKNNVNVVGTVSGGALTIMNGVSSILGSLGIGTSSPKAKLEVIGSFSGSRLYAASAFSGAGLTSCSGAGQKLLWNSTTQQFSCGVDLSSFGSGNVLTVGDSRYVNVSGDTMTGALTINLSSGYLGLKILNTASGNILHAEKNLTSSGTIVARNNIVTEQGTLITRYGLTFLSGSSLAEISGFNNYINFREGIGTDSTMRLTNQGNLRNIGSIQAGETLLTAGGTLAAKVDYAAGTNAYSVAVGDINGDGKADMAVANYGSDSVSVFINTGTGSFATKVDYTTGTSPYSVAIGDLNGDGKPDLAVSNNGSSSVSIFLNKGNGTFAAKVDYTTGSGPRFLAIGDLNGDGKQDVAAASFGGNSVSVLLNNGNGTFAAKVDYTVGSANPYSVAIGDLNGDGKPDLAVAVLNSTTIAIFLNNGDGTFAAKVNYTVGSDPTSIAIGDLNADGKPDLAVSNSSSSFISILINNGNGTFATKVDYTTGNNPYSVAIGDLSGDGKPDIAATNINGFVSIFINNGNGTFAAKVDYTTGSSPLSVAIGDLNSDGKADLAVSNYGSDSVSVFLNRSRTILFASASTGGVVGIGTPTPGAKLSVSGAVIISARGDLANARTDSGIALEVAGTISGSALKLMNNLSVSGTILSVGTITTRGTLSGNNLIVSHSASISGALLVLTSITSKGSLSGATFFGAGLGSCTNSNQKLLYDPATGKFNCSTDYAGSTFGSGNTITIGDARYVNASGDTMTGALTINLSSGFIGLKVLQTASGNILHAEKDLTSSGTLTVSGIARFKNNVNVVGTVSGGALTVMNGTSYFLGSLGIGNTSPKAKLDVLGTISGSTLVISKNGSFSGSLVVVSNITTRGTLSGTNLTVSKSASISGSLLVKTSITSKGSLSGVTIAGFNLGSCNGASQKLLYNNSTQKFECGSDVGANSIGSGNVLAIGDARYVKKQGDTMTGALIINLSSGFLGLRILQMASGSILHAEKSLTSSGLLMVTQSTVRGSGALVVEQRSNSTGAYIRGSGAHINAPLLVLDSSTGSYRAPHILFGYKGTFDVALWRTTGAVLNLSGHLLPSLTNKFDLGSSANRWRSLYLSGGTMYLGTAANQASINFNTSASRFGIDANADGTNELSILSIGNVGIGTGSPKAKLDVAGTISGTTLTISKNGSFSGALVVKSSITSRGSLSGVTIAGFNLGSCNGSSQKLLYNNSTQKFECGSDQSGGSANSGTVLSIGNARYVLKQGDTMTGTLKSRGFLLASGTTLSEMSGWNEYLNLPHSGIGTNSVTRLTNNGDLVNIGTIQSGEAHFRRGGTFAGKVDYTSGTPYSVAIGDLNGDGKQDLATVNVDGNSVSIFINTGTGSFATKVDYTTGSVPESVAIGDLNGDGKPDLAVANYTSASVSVFLNNGNGTFASKVDYTAGSNPHSVAIGDLNGDGKQDLAVANYFGNSVSVILNNGNGTFAAKVDYTTGSNPYSVAIGDLNGDGKKDLALANGGSDSVSVFLNNGNGTFVAKVDYTTGIVPYSVAIGDLNGDGKADLAVANYTSSSVSIFQNNGNGTFATKVDYTTGNNPYSVAIGDLTGDGKPDLAVANGNANTVSTFQNNGNGTFAAKIDYGAGTNPSSVAIGDLNNDGKADMATANYGTTVSIFLNLSRTILYASSGTGGAVGIGTPTPGSALAVSGAVLINANGNILNTKADVGLALEVIGTMSGRVLHAQDLITSSGSLIVEGTISGATLRGAGLASCNGASQKLLYNNSTNKFECGTDLTGASGTPFSSGNVLTIIDARYVKKQGDTMTGALTINLSSGFLGLKLLNTASGNILHAEKDLSSSGTLTVNGIARFKNNLNVVGTVSGAALTIMNGTSYMLGSVGIGNTSPKAKLDVSGTISGTTLTISRNGSFSGSLIVKNNLSGSSFYGAGLGDCNNSTNSKLIYNNATGKFGCATDQTAVGISYTAASNIFVNQSGDTMTGALTINLSSGYLGLKVLQTASGNILHAEKDLTSSGTLTVVGVARFKNNVNVVGTVSGAALTVMNGTSYFLGSLGIGNTSPKAKLDVRGTISGTTLTISGNGSFSGSLIVKNNLSGSSFYGAGLGDCNNSTSNKLIYNNATGKFGCATDQTAAGLSFTNADGIYVNQAGDTMTGALTINLSSGYLGLKILQTASGNILHAEKNLTSSGTIVSVGDIVSKNGTAKTKGYVLFSGATLAEMSGWNEYLNIIHSGLGTNSVTRLTNQGDLVNIGTIQSGEAHMRRGGTFAPKVDYTTGSGPYSLATGDLNGDGKADLAVAVSSGNSVAVLLNTGTGSFATKVDYTTGSGPISVAIGDLNGDGKPDLAVANQSDSSVSIFLNNGNGTFATKVDYTTGTSPHSVAIGDLNGDGKADLAVTKNGSASVAIFLNNGNGTFATNVDYTTGTSPFFVAIGDLNGDGKADLAVANNGSTSVSVLINSGNGTFAAKVDYTTGTQPQSVAIGDLNGDGKSDLTVANEGSNSVSVFINSGNGTFAAKVDYATATLPDSVAIGDLNGDGKADLAVANNGSTSISIFLNNGNGTFATKVDYTTGTSPYSVAIGDLNGDGKADLAVTNINSSSVSILLNVSKTILYASSGTGGAVGIGTPTPGSALAVSGAVIINANGNIVNTKADVGLALEVIGTASGRVLHAQDVLRSSGSLIVEGNMSGATLQGAGLASCNGATQKLLYNNSTKKFECGSDFLGSFGSGNVVTIGDSRYVRTSGSTMTGALTINLTSGYLGLKIMQTASGNILHAEKSLTSSGTIIAALDIIAKGTMKSDGYVFSSGTTLAEMSGWNEYTNLIHSGLGTNSVVRLTNQGDLVNIGTIQSGEAHMRRGGTFAAKVDYITGTSPYSVAIGDLNGDGKADLAVVNLNNSVSVFINTGTGSFATKVDYTTGTSPQSVAIGDLNGDGKPDLAVANENSDSVSVFMNNGNGTFATKVDYITGSLPYSVAIGDLNGDGKADLAVANYISNFGSSSVSVFINTGNGIFAAKVDYTTGTASTYVAIGDLNGDGKADLAVTNTLSDTVSVFLNNGNGTFATKVDYTTGSQPFSVAIGDLNGDGKADLAVVNLNNSVSVFINTGTGSFATKVDYTTGAGSYFLAIRDLNGDGKLDLVSANYYDDSVSVLLNNGNGTFATKVDYTTGDGPSGVAIGDLNGDGKADLAVTNTLSNTVSVFLNLSRTILYVSAGTGGAVGIGTPTPGSALAVSGAVLINANGNIVNTKADAGLALEVIGTASGRTLHAQDLLRSSGALTIEGASYFGSGLTIQTSHSNAGASEFTIITNYSSTSNKVFRVSASGAVYSDSRYNSNGADYAEWFKDSGQWLVASGQSAAPLEPGEVVCIDTTQNNAVKRCENSADPNVMGIVSTNPAFVGNVISGAEGIIPPGYALIGLIGQVPAKPTLENGPIRPGDSVTSATEPGFIRKAKAGESTVGVALEGFDGSTSLTTGGSQKSINILISRKNQSLTVETLEQKVLDQINAMNLTAEVSTLVNQASVNLNIDDRVTQALHEKMAAFDLASEINAILDARLSALGTSSGALIGNNSLTGSALAALAKAVSKELTKNTVTATGSTDQNYELQLSELRDQLLVLSTQSSELRASLGSGHTLHAAALSLSSGATISGSLHLNGSLIVPDQFSILHSSATTMSGTGFPILSVSGSAIEIGSLMASGSLKVIGNITITGLATFLGDVHIKGELVLSNRQAGFAVIPVSGTAVTVTFSGAMMTMPIVNVSPDTPILFAVTKVTSTGFTIRIGEPTQSPITFAYVALSADQPGTTLGHASANGAPVLIPFTVNALGQPVSSDAVWNGCIQGRPLTDSDGIPFSCSRYHDGMTWDHPDLHISFIYNPNHDPAILTIPEGYQVVVVDGQGVSTPVESAPEPVTSPEPVPVSDSGSTVISDPPVAPLIVPEIVPASTGSVPATAPVETQTEPTVNTQTEAGSGSIQQFILQLLQNSNTATGSSVSEE